jgi:1,2-dihydroxy-3-keto-5-methylthiopentene dioxygenase
MALVKFRGRKDVLSKRSDVESLLREHGVAYQRWGTERMPADLKGTTLTDAQKTKVLELFAPEISRENAEKGYVTADVVALAPDNPKLGEICAKFDKEHTHDLDEVRFVVSGHGTFTVRGAGSAAKEAIDITLGPGDYIVVPKDRRHWFTLLEDRKIVAVRLFKDQTGWTPHYAGTGTGPTEIPREDLSNTFPDVLAGP